MGGRIFRGMTDLGHQIRVVCLDQLSALGDDSADALFIVFLAENRHRDSRAALVHRFHVFRFRQVGESTKSRDLCGFVPTVAANLDVWST